MGDLIYKEAAIDLLMELTANGTNKGMISGADAAHRIEIMPAQPDHIPDITKMVCEDLISRQAAIDIVDEYSDPEYFYDWYSKIRTGICNLPSAEPERNKGFWYALEKGDKGYSAGDFKCSVCGEPNRCYIPKPNYCPNCGADMRGEQNDR